MEISWLGQSAFKLRGKSAVLITDPFDPEFTGLKFPKTEADIVTVSHDHEDHANTGAVVGTTYEAEGPGEYEIKGVAFTGVAGFHDDKEGAERGKNTIYNISIDGVRVCHLGDLGQKELSDAQLEEIGDVDVLLVPVGGTYTIGATDAAKVISQLEPRIIIPMHYAIPGLKFDLEPVDHFLKEMGQEGQVKVGKLTVSADKLPEEPQIALLEPS